MLTDMGFNQLQEVGRAIKKRYSINLLSNVTLNPASFFYCRSTNFCRTLMSLRALLSGLLEDRSELPGNQLPKIFTRPKSEENLFPQADGPCPAMAERRNIIFGKDLLSKSISWYDDFEQRIRSLLGFEEKVNWLTVKEVLTCYEVHGHDLPDGIHTGDIQKATKIAGFIWGALYKVELLN